jgi:hypothetical protein
MMAAQDVACPVEKDALERAVGDEAKLANEAG